MDVKTIGSFWSWHNNHEGQSRIYGKLDRALCNDMRVNTFPEAYVESRSTFSSDHTPMLLHLLSDSNAGHKTFRFFNHWLQGEGYFELVKKVWDTNYSKSDMFKLASKLKALKLALKD